MVTLWIICAIINTIIAWFEEWCSDEFAMQALLGWVSGPIKTIMYILQFLHYHFR